MENGPHEEADYPEQESVDDDETELPSAHSPDEDWEEPENDDDEPRQSKQARHSKGDSASGSSPAKRVAGPEVADTGSSSPSAKESTEPQDPLNVDPRLYATPGFRQTSFRLPRQRGR